MLGQPFDPNAEWFTHEHFRPHWSQPGAVVFITFRTHDSIPNGVLQRWEREKADWLGRRGHGGTKHWSLVLPTMTEKDRSDFWREFNRRREGFLDTGHGRCLLRRPELAGIVGESLLHFDAVRYRMGDFVIMPTHVHLLCAFPTAEAMSQQCDSWLHYTAFRINRAIGDRGEFLAAGAVRPPRPQSGAI